VTSHSLGQPSLALRRGSAALLALVTAVAAVILSGFAATPVAAAGQPQVGLGKAAPYAVLAGTTVTNTGPTKISGDLGLSPGSAVTGFPPGLVKNGSVHAATPGAKQAKEALTSAYLDAKGRTPATPVAHDLTGRNLAPGVYAAASFLRLTGTVTLNAHNDPNAVFIFQAGSTLITASRSAVRLVGGAQSCHVFWQVGSSATLGTRSTFVGTILALTSASLQTGATVKGRVLARNGAVTLDNNVITRPGPCATVRATSSPTASASRSSSGGSGGSGSSASPGSSGGSSGPVIPTGPPETGVAVPSRPGGTVLMLIGALALFGAVVVTSQGTRRRRGLSGRGPSRPRRARRG
jgi:Ice-binding-like